MVLNVVLNLVLNSISCFYFTIKVLCLYSNPLVLIPSIFSLLMNVYNISNVPLKQYHCKFQTLRRET